MLGQTSKTPLSNCLRLGLVDHTGLGLKPMFSVSVQRFTIGNFPYVPGHFPGSLQFSTAILFVIPRITYFLTIGKKLHERIEKRNIILKILQFQYFSSDLWKNNFFASIIIGTHFSRLYVFACQKSKCRVININSNIICTIFYVPIYGSYLS